jgi:hypothetical protein
MTKNKEEIIALFHRIAPHVAKEPLLMESALEAALGTAEPGHGGPLFAIAAAVLVMETNFITVEAAKTSKLLTGIHAEVSAITKDAKAQLAAWDEKKSST